MNVNLMVPAQSSRFLLISEYVPVFNKFSQVQILVDSHHLVETANAKRRQIYTCWFSPNKVGDEFAGNGCLS